MLSNYPLKIKVKLYSKLLIVKTRNHCCKFQLNTGKNYFYYNKAKSQNYSRALTPNKLFSTVFLKRFLKF